HRLVYLQCSFPQKERKYYCLFQSFSKNKIKSMAGIYGVLFNEPTKKEIYKNFYNADFPNTLQEEISYKNFIFGRSVLNKFKADRFLFENDQYIVCFEGINYSSLQHPEDIINAFEKRGPDFVADLKGEFSGFI